MNGGTPSAGVLPPDGEVGVGVGCSSAAVDDGSSASACLCPDGGVNVGAGCSCAVVEDGALASDVGCCGGSGLGVGTGCPCAAVSHGTAVEAVRLGFGLGSGSHGSCSGGGEAVDAAAATGLLISSRSLVNSRVMWTRRAASAPIAEGGAGAGAGADARACLATRPLGGMPPSPDRSGWTSSGASRRRLDALHRQQPCVLSLLSSPLVLSSSLFSPLAHY